MSDECQSLRQQLNEAYEKCTKIYETLAMLDENCRKERDILQQMVEDLRRTIQIQDEENQRLSKENFRFEMTERILRQRIETIENDRINLEKRCRKLDVVREQEKYIWNNLINRKDRNRLR